MDSINNISHARLPPLHRYKLKDENKAPFDLPSTKRAFPARDPVPDWQASSLNPLNLLRPNPINREPNCAPLDGFDLLLTAASSLSSLPSSPRAPNLSTPKPLINARPSPPTDAKTDVSPVLVVGSRSHPVIVGRGGASTVKLGRGNKQISRQHVSIEWDSRHRRFELIVLGVNGAIVDGTSFPVHARAVLRDGATVDVLGARFVFSHPPEPEQMIPSDPVLTSEIDFEVPVTPPCPRAVIHVGSSSPTSLLDLPDVDEVEMRAVQRGKVGRILFQEQAGDGRMPRLSSLSSMQKDNSVEEADAANDNVEEDIVIDAGEEERSASVTGTEELQKDYDYVELVVDALVFSRKSSMTVREIHSHILTTLPQYKNQSAELWNAQIGATLTAHACFGKIARTGKTADGTPKEDLYYYVSDKDPVEWRRQTYVEVGRSARKCTLADKQYFWKMPPKLPNHRYRSSYIPPPQRVQAVTPASVGPHENCLSSLPFVEPSVTAGKRKGARRTDGKRTGKKLKVALSSSLMEEEEDLHSSDSSVVNDDEVGGWFDQE
ncbi:hypothetical protein BC937DRAFT_88798 [Endogone sp. FLAS-F59071]|nr:hypothetical protein BC937DRAFT_88798 [Endogone sp. FLAS-F59071]|eukprot:RUS18413.1 hypothetical protein BC937DRAFT_88798 [Endogone sp. FLAS-F59071]